MWLSLYIASLIFGGAFVGLSVFSGLGGDGDAELDKEFEFDKELEFEFDKELELEFDKELDLDLDHDVDGDADGNGELQGEQDIEVRKRTKKFRPYLSFKFYTFTLAFFGLTGTLLTLLGSGVILTFLMSLLMGLGSGLGMTYLLHSANHSEGGRVATGRDLLGTSAKVIIPIRPGQLGKVKLRIKGQVVEMMAKQFEDEDTEKVVFDFEEECMVLGIEDGVVQVMHRSELERRKQS